MVGEQPVVAQGHVLLLPLLVERFAASLQQHALHRGDTNLFNTNFVTGDCDQTYLCSSRL